MLIQSFTLIDHFPAESNSCIWRSLIYITSPLAISLLKNYTIFIFHEHYLKPSSGRIPSDNSKNLEFIINFFPLLRVIKWQYCVFYKTFTLMVLLSLLLKKLHQSFTIKINISVHIIHIVNSCNIRLQCSCIVTTKHSVVVVQMSKLYWTPLNS